MLQAIIKVLVTSDLVVAISETAKRSTFAGAILASLPITSMLAMAWLWADTRDPEKIASLATGIFWLILPSLTMLLVLPLLLRRGIPFAPSMLISALATAGSYVVMVQVLARFGIEI